MRHVRSVLSVDTEEGASIIFYKGAPSLCNLSHTAAIFTDILVQTVLEPGIRGKMRREIFYFAFAE